jgi:hypothetical protein
MPSFTPEGDHRGQRSRRATAEWGERPSRHQPTEAEDVLDAAFLSRLVQIFKDVRARAQQ